MINFIRKRARIDVENIDSYVSDGRNIKYVALRYGKEPDDVVTLERGDTLELNILPRWIVHLVRLIKLKHDPRPLL